MQRDLDEIRAEPKRRRSRHPIPESKYWTPQKKGKHRAERPSDTSCLIDLWEDKFERNIADLVRGATDDAYEVKIEGWEYGRIKGRSEQQVCCRVAMVSKDHGSRLYATYRVFPFLDDRVEAISPDADTPARLTLDQVLATGGYTVIGRYDERAA